MVLQSGVRPYCFDYPMPYNIGNDPSGQIGFLIEQAMWVAVAEKRRLTPDDDPDIDSFKLVLYEPPGLNATFQNFEPTPEGSIFGTPMGEFDPLWAAVLDYIVDTRNALRSMFGEFDSEYDTDEIEADFLNNWYPGSSGQVFLLSPENTVSGPHAREEIQLDVEFVFPTIEEVPTEVCSLDINSLGGSGVLFDRDYGELIYNPYPWVAETRLGSVADGIGFDSDFRERASVVMKPIYPMFQKTNGSLITVNSREAIGVAGWTPSTPWSIDQLALGRVRIDGDNFTADTEFLISQEDLRDVVETTDMTFVSHFSAPDSVVSRPRNYDQENQIVDSGSAFCSPSAKSEGLYRIAAVNRFTNFPNTTIESGLISTYPQPSSLLGFNYRDSDTQQFNEGYEVFDEGFWINEGSGLALISPLTGRAMYTRLADHFGAARGVNGNPTGIAGGWQRGHGMLVVGGSVYKTESTSSSVGTFRIAAFDEETLDYQNNLEHTFVSSGPSTVTDLEHDGTDFWVMDSSASAGEIYQFDGSTFAFIHQWEATSIPFSKDKLFWIPSMSQFFVKTGGASSPQELIPITFPPPPTSIPTTGTAKPITNFLGGAIRDVYDIIEVNGATTIDDGIYALCNVSGVIGGGVGYTSDVVICRIEEGASEWFVRSQLKVQDVNIRGGTDETNLNFRFRAVP